MTGLGVTLGEHKKALSVWLLLAAVLVAGVAYGELTGWQAPIDRDMLRAFLERARATPFAFPVAVATYIVGGAVLFPVTVLNLLMAMVFGPLWGVLYALAGVLAAASFFFGIGHLLGKKHWRRLMGERAKKIDAMVGNSGIIGVMLVRFVPIAPFTIVNLLLGVSSARFFDYLAATLLASIPGAVARGLVGDSLVQIVLDPSPQTMAYLGGGLALWAGVVFGSFRLARRLKARKDQGGASTPSG